MWSCGEARRVLSQEIPRENDVRDSSGVEVPFLPSFSGHLFHSRHGWSQEATSLLHYGNYSLRTPCGHGQMRAHGPCVLLHPNPNPKLQQGLPCDRDTEW